MTSFTIDLGDAQYPVYFTDDGMEFLRARLEELGSDMLFYIIVDEFIYRNFDLSNLQDSKFLFYVVKGGKNNKNFYSAMKVFEDLDSRNIARDATIVAVGGGVVGDLGAFVASLWYRGVNLVHIPTTLLAAVDSCVGGKTAINFRSTVNAVGTYHHPKALIIDTKTLSSLPAREVSSGFGEIIKYAMLGGDEILEVLEDCDGISDAPFERLVWLSLKEKERYVRGDVKEAANRLFLNFGHTIGHAIEFSTVYEGRESLRHGEGVALGMVAIFEVCNDLGYLKPEDTILLKNLLVKFGLPTTFSSASVNMHRSALIHKITGMAFKDKKRTSKYLRLIVLQGIGNPSIHKTDDGDLIRRAIESVIE